MAELSNDIRLAVDSGKAVFGAREASATINDGSAKIIIVASSSKKNLVNDTLHIAKLADIKVIVFNGNPIELGVVCGKPYSVSMVSITEVGSSNILNESY